MIQELWDKVLTEWPYSDRALFTLSLFLAHNLIWYPGMLFLTIVYNWNLFPQYKIQKSKWPSTELTRSAIKELAIIHFCVHPLVGYFVLYDVFTYFGATNFRAPLPPFSRVAFDIVVCLFILDTYFYWVHRLMHYFPALYRMVHKKHHTFNVSTGIASEFAGVIFVCSHPLVGCLFLSIRMSESLEAHSGYQLPFSPWRLLAPLHDGSQFHDYHHSAQVNNFGVFTFWDWLMGTDKVYREALKKKSK